MTTTPITPPALDGGGHAITVRAQQATDGSIALNSVPEVAGTPVSTTNPLPVADAAVATALATLISEDTGLATAAGQASALTQQTAAAAALGTPADVAWSGTGNATNIGALKALWVALTGNLRVVLQAGTAVIGKVGLQVGGADVALANPVYARLTDGTTTVVVTPQGSVSVSGQAAAGSPPATPPIAVSGVDGGGLKRHLLTDADGVPLTRLPGGAGTDHSANKPALLAVQQTIAPNALRNGFYLQNQSADTIQIVLDHDLTGNNYTVCLAAPNGAGNQGSDWSFAQAGIRHTGQIRICAGATDQFAATEF